MVIYLAMKLNVEVKLNLTIFSLVPSTEMTTRGRQNTADELGLCSSNMQVGEVKDELVHHTSAYQFVCLFVFSNELILLCFTAVIFVFRNKHREVTSSRGQYCLKMRVMICAE